MLLGDSFLGVWRKVACAAAAVALAVLATASPAGAHAQLIKADPARAAVLTDAPQRVTLTFDEPVSKVGDTVISVVGPDGTAEDDGMTTVDGAVVSIGLKVLIPGASTVTYRVVSDDGHIISDSYQFQFDSDIRSMPDSGVVASAAPSVTAATSSSAPVTTAEAAGSKGGLRLSVGKIATIAVFAGVYVFVARWMKAYRRRSLGR